MPTSHHQKWQQRWQWSELHLDQVPTREPGISPEMMLSETQERMLLVVEKGTEQKFLIYLKNMNLIVR